MYNWNGRIFAGFDIETATARKMNIHPEGWNPMESSTSGPLAEFTIPGYIDLGLKAEFKTAGNMSLWLKGGNLLGQVIQRMPGCAVKGASVTAGISLSLK